MITAVGCDPQAGSGAGSAHNRHIHYSPRAPPGRTVAGVQPAVPRQRRDLVVSGAGATRLDMDLRAGRSVALYRGVYVAAGHANGLLVRVTAAVRTQGSLAVATYTTSAALHGFRWLP